MENLTYIALSIWGLFTTYLLFEIFYDTKSISPKKKWAIFIIFYITTESIYKYIDIPIFTLITNVILLFVVAWNYEKNVMKNIISASLIYLIMLASEVTALSFVKYKNFYIFQGNEIAIEEQFFLAKLITFLVAIVLNKCKALKYDQYMTKGHLLIMLSISSMSIYVILLIFSYKSIAVIWRAIGIIGMFVICIGIFYLYNIVLNLAKNEFEKIIYQKEADYQKNQLEVINESLGKVKSLKHDLNNHLNTIIQVIEEGKPALAIEHIKELSTDYNSKRSLANTGNITIDSILNYKIPKMEELNIEYKLDIAIPYNLELNSFDMVVILANAIDNAIEAVAKLEEKQRWIKIEIKYKKKRLLINLENPYKELIFDENKIITSKKDKGNHGIGLKSIITNIEKNGGTVKIDTEENIFKINIII